MPESVNLITPDGATISVPADQQQGMIDLGYRPTTGAEEVVRGRESTLEERYGDSTGAAAVQGLARGATLGLSDIALEGTGLVTTEGLRETRERNRAASITGEVVGDIGGAVLSGGAGTLGSIGRATVSGQLTRLGERVAGRAVQSPVARAAIGNAIEGTIAAPAQYLAEERLKENPGYSAEVLLSEAGRGFLLGGAVGGGFAAAGKGLGAVATRLDGASSPTKLEEVLDTVTAKEADAITEGATAPTIAPKKKQSVRSVVPLDERSKAAVLERAGEFTRAIDDQSTYVRGARREIQDLAPNIPPAQAAELQIAEQALRDATAAARRQFREIGRAVNKGEMPSALVDDQAAAVATLTRLDQARAALDERLAAARTGIPAETPTPIPTTPAAEAPAGAAAPAIEATPDNLAILRRSEVLEDGTRLDPETGEILDDPGWERLAQDLGRVQQARGGAAVPDWVAQGLERRRLGDVREEIREIGARELGPRARGGRSRSTESVIRYGAGELPADLRAPISFGGARNIGEAAEEIGEQTGRRAFTDEALSSWTARWKSSIDDAGTANLGKLPDEAAQQWYSIEYQLRRLGRGEIDAPAARAEIDDILTGKAPLRTPPAPEEPIGVTPAPTPAPATTPAPARVPDDAIPPPRDLDAPAPAPARMPGPDDLVPDAEAPPPSPLSAVSLEPPEPNKGALKSLGKNAADVLALWETGQSLGLPLPSPGSLMGPLSPLFKLYAGYRALRLAASRTGFIRATEATNAAAKVTETRDRITKIARQVATAGSKGLSSQALQSAATRAAVRITAPEATEEIRAVQQLQGRPDRIHARAEAMTASAPQEVQAAGRSVAERKLAFLARAAPRSPWTGTPFADEWEPSPMELDRWREVRDALERPLDALEALAAGNYSPEAIDAVREVYPEVFGGFRQAVLEQVDEIVRNAPYSTRVVLGDALEVPLDGTQLPFYEQGIAQTQQVQATAAAGQDGQPRGASYIPAQSAIAARAQTPQERRAAR